MGSAQSLNRPDLAAQRGKIPAPIQPCNGRGLALAPWGRRGHYLTPWEEGGMTWSQFGQVEGRGCRAAPLDGVWEGEHSLVPWEEGDVA